MKCYESFIPFTTENLTLQYKLTTKRPGINLITNLGTCIMDQQHWNEQNSSINLHSHKINFPATLFLSDERQSTG